MNDDTPQEDSLRDTLEEAFDDDADSGDDNNDNDEAPTGDDEGTQESDAGDGGEAGSDDGESEGEGDGGEGAGGTEGEGEEGEQVADIVAKSNHKVPAGWDAKSREHWDKIPEEVQAQIAAREDEVARTIHGTLDARKTHEFLSNLSSNYAPVLAAEGVSSPVEAIEGLFKTVSVLRLGSPQQKASQLADIIGTYGIDIGMLDSALSGQGFTNDPNGAGNANMEHLIDQKMAPINEVLQRIGQVEQNNASNRQGVADQEVVDFAKDAEFLNDVRSDMADLLDMASARGQDMTLKEAYDKCCAMRPEIQSVLSDRSANQELLDGKERAAKKLNAGSSIRGAGGNSSGKGGDMSLRDQISSIWNDYEEN